MLFFLAAIGKGNLCVSRKTKWPCLPLVLWQVAMLVSHGGFGKSSLSPLQCGCGKDFQLVISWQRLWVIAPWLFCRGGRTQYVPVRVTVTLTLKILQLLEDIDLNQAPKCEASVWPLPPATWWEVFTKHIVSPSRPAFVWTKTTSPSLFFKTTPLFPF